MWIIHTMKASEMVELVVLLGDSEKLTVATNLIQYPSPTFVEISLETNPMIGLHEQR